MWKQDCRERRAEEGEEGAEGLGCLWSRWLYLTPRLQGFLLLLPHLSNAAFYYTLSLESYNSVCVGGLDDGQCGTSELTLLPQLLHKLVLVFVVNPVRGGGYHRRRTWQGQTAGFSASIKQVWRACR